MFYFHLREFKISSQKQNTAFEKDFRSMFKIKSHSLSFSFPMFHI